MDDNQVKAAPSDAQSGKSDKKKKMGRVVAIIGGVLLIGCIVGGFLLTNRDDGGGGTSIGSYEGKSMEEIQAELDKQMLESMMTVSLDVTPTLSKDGKKLEVRVENVKDNKFEQSILVEQGGKVVGRYEGLKPGEKLDYVDVDGCEPGSATVTIQRFDSETGKVVGNASGFEVEVVR